MTGVQTCALPIGFVGLDALPIPEYGRSHVYYLNGYDAGTEANDALAGTIPGSADGGTGFDAMRDDVDFVAMHPGTVGADDGYADSVLEGSHKFDGPAAKLTITRIN